MPKALSTVITSGYPALPISRYHRANAVFRNLPELSKTVYRLEKRLNELTGETEE